MSATTTTRTRSETDSDPTTGDTDPDTLVERHLVLVDQLVNKLAASYPAHVDRDELRGAGAEGLVEAARRYDPSSGVPFARFAAIRIRGAILDATRGSDWATRRLRRDLRAIDEAAGRLRERLNRTADDTEIADELGVEVDAVRRCRAAALTSNLLTLDQPVGGQGGDASPLSDHLAEEDPSWLPEPSMERTELIDALRFAMKHLPELPGKVLMAHHFEGRLLRDIAEDLGVTEARASQLRHEAIHALQAYFATRFEDVPDVPDDTPGKRRRAEYVSTVTNIGSRQAPRARPVADEPSVPQPVTA